MESIISAIIGGIFTLLGVFITYYLQKRDKQKLAMEKSTPFSQVESTPITHVEKIIPKEKKTIFSFKKPLLSPGKKIKYGIILLIVDFIIICIIVDVYNLNENEPSWENIFALIVGGVIPTFSFYLIISGIINAIKNYISNKNKNPR